MKDLKMEAVIKIAAFVFSAGAASAAIMTIPSLNKRVDAQEVKMAVAEAHREAMKESMDALKLEVRSLGSKIDRLSTKIGERMDDR